MRKPSWAIWIMACGPAVPVGGESVGGESAGGTGTGSPPTSASGAPPGATTVDDDAPGNSEVGTTPPDDGPPIDTRDLGAVDSSGSPGGTTWGGNDDAGPLEPGYDTEAGEPGGAGPGAIDDAIGDVELSNADVLAAAVYTDGAMVDFRVQLVDRPFPAELTYDITWCLDVAGSAGNWSCMTHSDTIDAFVGVVAVPPYDGEAYGSETPGLSPCEHGSYEPDTKTLRLLVPRELAGDGEDFDWILFVNFAGSGGDAEYVPDVGAAPVEHVDVFPPFAGAPSCD